MEIFRGLLNGFPPYVILIALAVLTHIGFPSGSVLNLIYSIVFTALILVTLGLRGTVQADAEGVNIWIKLLGIPITVKSYYYEDIIDVSCKTEHRRHRTVNYRTMAFALTLTNGRKLWFKKKLKYSKGQYTSVGCESMLELCSYVRQQCKSGIYRRLPTVKAL